MVMMLAPSRVALEDNAGARDDDGAEAKPRKAPQQRAPGSAEPAEINPEQI